MKNQLLFGLVLLMAFLPLTSAAHYIVGYVNSTTGEDVNGLTVYLYTPEKGMSFNISDIVGVTGNSRTDNIYMMDVEMLYEAYIGNEVRVTIDGVNYVSVFITGYGYDIAPTLYYETPTPVEEPVIEPEPIVEEPVVKPAPVKPKIKKPKRVSLARARLFR